MNDHESVYEKLTPIFRGVFDDDSIVLRPDLAAEDVETWDSLSHIRLMLKVERAFSVRLTAADVGKLKNVGDLVDLLLRKTSPSS